MKKEQIILNEERNVTLTAYLQDVGGEFTFVTKRPAILVLPGGAYQYCSTREADPIAFPYLKAGFQVFILNYSVREHALWPNPLLDYEQAMELIQSNANLFGIAADKIAVIGFSAGGHLAAAAATLSKIRPNAALLGYALVGEDIKICNPSAPDTIAAIDQNTCPCFLFATRTDGVVPVINSIDFMAALSKYDIAFESHIYAYGPHGFSTADSSIHHPDTPICKRVPNWVNDSIAWLKEVFGDFGANGFTAPAFQPHVTDDFAPYLSTNCTFQKIMNTKEAKSMIEPYLNMKLEALGLAPNDILPALSNSQLQLGNCLVFMNIADAEIREINKKLQSIPNPTALK